MSRRLVFFVFVSLMVLLAVVEGTADTNHGKKNRTSSEKPTGAADTLAAPLILQLAGTLFPLLLHKLF